MLIATTVVIWDRWWLLSKYLWIYSAMVSPLFHPHGERGVVVWIRASDIGTTTPSLVIWEAGEESEAGYLIKANWDFQGMHKRSEVLPGGSYY